MAPEKKEEAGGGGPEGGRSGLYRWLPFALLLVFLMAGGFYSLITMRQAAHKLAGGDNYTQFSANSAVYGSGVPASKSAELFAAEEPAAGESVPGITPGADGGRELKAEDGGDRAAGAGAGGAAGPAAGTGQATAGEERPAGAAEQGVSQGASQSASQGAASLGARLQARASSFGKVSGAGAPKMAAAAGVEGFQANGPAAARPAAHGGTQTEARKKGGGGSVMEALKGAFRASFYSSRLASHDAARSWIARSFDATPEAATAIQYDEKMRGQLDVLDPNSVPKFLREQDLSAAEAKTLAVSEVGKPEMDKEGTKEALKADKSYQANKALSGVANSTINGMFAGISGTGSPETPAGPADAGAYTDMETFADPESEADLKDLQIEEFIDTEGFGEECGCTPKSPCCCMPQNGGGSGSADFLWSGSGSGDFPVSGAGLVFQ